MNDKLQELFHLQLFSLYLIIWLVDDETKRVISTEQNVVNSDGKLNIELNDILSSVKIKYKHDAKLCDLITTYFELNREVGKLVSEAVISKELEIKVSELHANLVGNKDKQMSLKQKLTLQANKDVALSNKSKRNK